MSKRRPKVYLAGPDVFHEAVFDIAARKKQICAGLGLSGLFPLDNALPEDAARTPAATAALIYRANIELLEQADAVIAHVSPFLGALADDGTAFEIGFAVARKLPIALYDNSAGDTAAKAAQVSHRLLNPFAPPRITPEDFGAPVNLMMAVPARELGGVVQGDVATPWDDLSRFEIAAERLASHLLGTRPAGLSRSSESP